MLAEEPNVAQLTKERLLREADTERKGARARERMNGIIAYECEWRRNEMGGMIDK